jgi:hypothetical protein
MPGTPSAYVVTHGGDRAEAMREAVEKAAAIIASGGEAPKAPLAPPAEQQTQPGAVYAELPEPDFGPGRYLGKATGDAYTKEQLRDFADATHALRMQAAPKAAPESIRSILIRCREFIDTTKVPAYPAGADLADEIDVLLAAQPAPAPLSEMPYEKRKAIQEGEQIGASDAWFKARHEMLDTVDRRNVFRAGFDRGWNAAIAAQGGK